MIKAVIFDIDNTLYSYDENHIYGMEALAVYCRDSFGITTDEMQACYRKAGRIMTDRIGTDTAAIHSRMLRMQCMLELLEQPLFPHARNMYHAYWDTFIQHIQSNPGILEFMKELKKRKIRIGIGTDMTAYVQYRKLEAIGVTSYIDFIVTSEDYDSATESRWTCATVWKKREFVRKNVHSSVIMSEKILKVHGRAA